MLVFYSGFPTDFWSRQFNLFKICIDNQSNWKLLVQMVAFDKAFSSQVTNNAV